MIAVTALLETNPIQTLMPVWCEEFHIGKNDLDRTHLMLKLIHSLFKSSDSFKVIINVPTFHKLHLQELQYLYFLIINIVLGCPNP